VFLAPAGRVKREERGPPEGFLRTLVVALDTAQYQLDVNALAAHGGEDLYGSFNLIMRRKPKENNFKAVLQVGGAHAGLLLLAAGDAWLCGLRMSAALHAWAQGVCRESWHDVPCFGGMQAPLHLDICWHLHHCF
jgi:hypothetical protein